MTETNKHSDDIKKAFHKIDEVENLAQRTGVQDHTNTAEYGDSYFESDVTGDGMGEEDAGQDGVGYTKVMDARGDLNPSLATHDAAIGVEPPRGYHRTDKDWGKTDPDGPRFAKTHEITGTYHAAVDGDGVLVDDTVVQRPDGKGGVYGTALKGARAERAAVIISNRATKRVGRAVVDRAVKVADELRQ